MLLLPLITQALDKVGEGLAVLMSTANDQADDIQTKKLFLGPESGLT